jgi:hypothetical protein
MRPLITLATVTLLLTGCGGSNDEAGPVTDPAVSAATTEAAESEPSFIETLPDTVTPETNAYDSGGFTGDFADTYEVAREICGGSGVAAIAEEFGSAAEPKAAARAYANALSNEGPHHDASYSGCLKALSEHK